MKDVDHETMAHAGRAEHPPHVVPGEAHTRMGVLERRHQVC